MGEKATAADPAVGAGECLGVGCGGEIDGEEGNQGERGRCRVECASVGKRLGRAR